MITLELSRSGSFSTQEDLDQESIESRLEGGLINPLPKPEAKKLERSDTASRLSLREYSSKTHDLVYIGEGTQNKVYFVRNKQSGQVLSALKATQNPAEIANLKKEIKLRRVINNHLLPSNIPYHSDIRHILESFKLTPEQIKNKLVLNQSTTMSHFEKPNWQVAALPPVEHAEELIGKARTLLTADSQTQANLIKASLTGCRDVLVILAILHASGIAHLDVKPENILINDNGEGFLVDYGFAENVHHKTITQSKGSAEYAPPEAFEEITPKGYAADVYSAGMTLALALLGEQRQLSPDTHPLDPDNMVRDPRIVPALINAFGDSGFQTIVDLIHGSDQSDSLQNSMLAHYPHQRPTAFDAALQLNHLCKAFGLNRPLSSQTY